MNAAQIGNTSARPESCFLLASDSVRTTHHAMSKSHIWLNTNQSFSKNASESSVSYINNAVGVRRRRSHNAGQTRFIPRSVRLMRATAPRPDVSQKVEMQPPIPDPRFSPPVAPSPSAPMQGDGTGGVIPFKNPNALLSYYIGLFSLIPVLGLAMGPAAIILGVKGLKYAKQYPVVKGQVHAWVGIVCGAIWSVFNYALLLLVLAAVLLRNRG